MTIIYLDPIGGNDANNGLTFANRKRTIYAATNLTAEGDTVRMIASPDPFSVGSATWTDNSKDIAWTNTSNLKVDGCESGWTGVTNVTVSHSGFYAAKTGSNYLQCVIAGAFTTGKIAYKALPAPLTVSAFQQIALYFMTNSYTGTVMNFKVCLCSDTTGNTIVAEVSKTLTAGVTIMGDNLWTPLVLDYGTAFPGTAINSVAIYLNADAGAGAPIFAFDGISLCKAPGASDLIDLWSMIGKNAGAETEWYSVADLSETGVTLGGCRRIANTNARPYRGTTESVTTYIRNPLVIGQPWTSTEYRLNHNKYTLEGGYNRTDMSTKTGETWLCGSQLFTGMIPDLPYPDDLSILNIGLTHFIVGASSLLVGQGHLQATNVYDFLGFIACETPVTFTPTGGSSSNRYAGFFKFSCKQVWGHTVAMNTPSRPGEYTVGRIHGFYNSDTSYAAWLQGSSFEVNPTVYKIGKIDNNFTGININTTVPELKLTGTVIENNTNNFIVNTSSIQAQPYRLHFDNMADLMIEPDTDGSVLFYALDNYPTIVRQTRIDGDPNKNRVTINGNQMFESSTAIRHTASGYSWRLYVPRWGWLHNDRPAGAAGHQLALVACEADKEVTVTVWIYVEFNVYTQYDDPTVDPTATFGIMVLPDITMELALIQAPADMSIIGSWQQVTLTFTPGSTGVVPVCAYVHANYKSYGPAELTPPDVYSAYFDDVEVTQEA